MGVDAFSKTLSVSVPLRWTDVELKLKDRRETCSPSLYLKKLRFMLKQHKIDSKSRKMVLLDKLWDDVVAGPHPDQGLGKLRKITTGMPFPIKDGEDGGNHERSWSMPATPGGTPTTPGSPSISLTRGNVWRSVFNPGSNLATKSIGAEVFDKPQPNSPTVYDWLYSGDTRSKHR